MDVSRLQAIFETWAKDPAKVQASQSQFELLVYYFYLNEDFNKLFYLLNKTKNLE